MMNVPGPLGNVGTFPKRNASFMASPCVVIDLGTLNLVIKALRIIVDLFVDVVATSQLPSRCPTPRCRSDAWLLGACPGSWSGGNLTVTGALTGTHMKIANAHWRADWRADWR